MDTPTIIYEEETLPDLTEIEAIEKEANETSANMADISDDEPTFLDEQVTVSTNNSNDVIIVHTEPGPILKFSPLNSASRKECGPLVHIHNCGIIQYTNISQELIGEPRNVYMVARDGNCYFRCISYALSGTEDHHKSICNVQCNYISWFPGRLRALITDFNEMEDRRKYIKRSSMRSNGTWATEVEILATAKCFRRDVFTYYDNKWQCDSYLANYSDDAIYLVNKSDHFNFVLRP